MPLTPAETKPKLTPEDEAALKKAVDIIDAALPHRRSREVVFCARAAIPEGADKAFELGVLSYPALMALVQKYRHPNPVDNTGGGWHVYPDIRSDVDATLKLVDPDG